MPFLLGKAGISADLWKSTSSGFEMKNPTILPDVMTQMGHMLGLKSGKVAHSRFRKI